MTVSVLLPAAGSGERLGRGPKAYVRIGGQTLLQWALKGFAWADELLVALPPGHAAPDDQARYLQGGSTRQQSVYNLLQQATGEVVLVHDVARPFVSHVLIQRVLEGVEQHGAAVPAIAVPDTLIAPQQQQYGRVVPREVHRLVQTPQGFRRDWLLEAHQQAAERGLEATDDAQLVLAMGRSVQLVEGDRQLFKLTYPDDLRMAEGLASIWEA